MREFFLIFFFILKFIKSFDYAFEPIEENIPKISTLYIPGKSYKIYEYYPSCRTEEEKKKINKSMYFILDADNGIRFYIYDDYSKIEQDDSGKFRNYTWGSLTCLKRFCLKNYTCNQTYYFVIFFEHARKFLPKYQLSIFDAKSDIIQFNPLLSNFFFFIQTTDNPMNLIYKYEKNQIVLIRFKRKCKLKIFENSTLLYNKEQKDNYEILKFVFKKNIEYNITFESDKDYYDYDLVTIDFQFLEENNYIKHEFTKSSLIIFSNSEYYIEIDLSNYALGEDIILLMLADGTHYSINYQYKNKFIDNNLTKIIDSEYYGGIFG